MRDLVQVCRSRRVAVATERRTPAVMTEAVVQHTTPCITSSPARIDFTRHCRAHVTRCHCDSARRVTR